MSHDIRSAAVAAAALRAPAGDPAPERRIFRRVPLRVAVVMTAGSGAFTGMTVNLSVGGVFVAVSGRMKATVGDPLRIEIPLGDAGDRSIQVAGTVVRVEQGGIAVRFHDMDRIAFHTLLAAVNRHPG